MSSFVDMWLQVNDNLEESLLVDFFNHSSSALHLGPSSPMRTNLITDRLHMSQSMSTTAMSVASQANTNAVSCQGIDTHVLR